MKATGIVRRIDDLGRIVIPKEIRRTMRIREGDPLEIYTQSSTEIVFKKYSPIGEMGAFAAQYVEILSKTSGVPVMICDREQIIAASGLPKREVLEQKISDSLSKSLQERKIHISGKEDPLYPVDGVDRQALISVPIVSEGDLGGAVIFVDDGAADADEGNLKLAKSAAMFLGKQIDS